MPLRTIPEPAHVGEAHENNPEHEDLRKKASAWIRGNPTAYAMFAGFARDMAAKGRRFGAKALAERVRWESSLKGSGDTFKLNNDLIAYIARSVAAEFPEVAPFLSFRRTSW